MKSSPAQKKYNMSEKRKEANRRLEQTEKSLAVRRAYRMSHKEQQRAYMKEYVAAGKGRISYRKYRASGKAAITQREYVKNKKEVDLQYKVASSLRTRLYHALKGDQKVGSAVRDLGCTISELKFYLEGQFQDGMTWENWSLHGWHIDHKMPLAYFDLTDREQFLQAVHYTNLQPMWAKENIKKSKLIKV